MFIIKMKLLYYPDKFLNKVLKEETKFDQFKLTKIKKQMIKLMTDKNGCGLAASQVGLNKRLFIVRHDLYINPEILFYDNEIESTEGCLSIPGLSYKVKRFNDIEIKAYNEFNQLIEKKLTGLEAIIFQHEFDHINGILINKNL